MVDFNDFCKERRGTHLERGEDGEKLFADDVKGCQVGAGHGEIGCGACCVADDRDAGSRRVSSLFLFSGERVGG